jgi:hypothetical protein
VGCGKFSPEKASGASRARPELLRMMDPTPGGRCGGGLKTGSSGHIPRGKDGHDEPFSPASPNLSAISFENAPEPAVKLQIKEVSDLDVPLKFTSDQKQLAFLLLNEGKSAQDIAGIVMSTVQPFTRLAFGQFVGVFSYG